eukprot:11158456-Lingulodinium_polyedra.AAC.1
MQPTHGRANFSRGPGQSAHTLEVRVRRGPHYLKPADALQEGLGHLAKKLGLNIELNAVLGYLGGPIHNHICIVICFAGL